MAEINKISGIGNVNTETTIKNRAEKKTLKEDVKAYSQDKVQISESKTTKQTEMVSLADKPASTREERPLTISLGGGFPNGLSLGVNYNINDKFAVGGSIGTLALVNDYTVHGRYYFAGSERFGAYTQTTGHLIQNNLYSLWGGERFAGALSQTVGLEFRTRNGFTINGDIGAAVGTSTGKLAPIPAFNLGVGYSF